MARGDSATEAIEPVFADKDRIFALLGVPENTLRQLAREMVVAAHKLADGDRGKCVYLFADVKAWVASRPAPEWVLNYQRNLNKAKGVNNEA